MQDLSLDRSQLRNMFISRTRWANWKNDPLNADASFRCYFRLSQDNESVLLMDAPPSTENLSAYIKIAKYLRSAGLSAPEILDYDLDSGFAVIQDFGTNTYTALLRSGENEKKLYQLAVNALTVLHSQVPIKNINLPHYTDGYYQKEIDLFSQWYWPARTGQHMTSTQLQQYNGIWQAIFAALPPPQPTLVLRDYHVDNLMLLDGEQGVSACGLLDFQDALIGSTAYDLVSLFEDARRDVNQVMANQLLKNYCATMSAEDNASFNQWYNVLGAHRHTKVAGIFVRLCVRDGKQNYLNFIPRVLTLLARSLQTQEMAPLALWLEEHHPGPIDAPLKVNIDQLRPMLGLNSTLK